ncbi:MAG: AAA family ATPase [Ignisphaera sp.]
MMQEHYTVDNILKVKVEVGSLLRGELFIDGIAVLIGPPRSGKSLLLRLMYDTLYYAEKKVQPMDLSLIASEIIKDNEVIKMDIEGVAEVVCNNIESRGTCDVNPYTEYIPKPLYIPSSVEDIIKYGYIPPFEPFMEFLNLVNLLKIGFVDINNEDMKKIIDTISQHDKMLRSVSLRTVRSRLYEELSDRIIPIELSSSAVVKLGVLEEAMVRGLLKRYGVVLMDEPESNLHPTEVLRLALLMHCIARRSKVVVVTHDFLFLDAVTRPEKLNSIFATNIEPANVRLYILRDGAIHEINKVSSIIKGYTDDILKLYGISGD